MTEQGKKICAVAMKKGQAQNGFEMTVGEMLEIWKRPKKNKKGSRNT